MGWAVLFVSVSIAALGAVWLAASADEHIPFSAEHPPGFPPEFSDALAIAQSDPRVREALAAYDDEKFIRGKTWFPRLAQEGHRYVEVRWSVDGGTATAEFVVDLTTRTVCHKC